MGPYKYPTTHFAFRPSPGLLRQLILSFCLISVVSCTGHGEQRAEFLIFGTIMNVTTWGVPEKQAEQAFAELNVLFQAMHKDWHAWEKGQLTEINQAFSAGLSVKASADIVELIRRSQQLEKKSGGRFNPAIGALINLWGFHTSQFPIIGPPPDAEDIDRLLGQAPSSLDVVIGDQLMLESSNPAVQLDFGGIAKGYAIDLACIRLRELGIENAIVNAGGDLRAFGRRGPRQWRVGIRNPAGGIIGGVEAGTDEAIFTSGIYERFRQHQQERYPHILDPLTGWPVAGLASVTVIAEEGLLADAAATALVVAGAEDWVSVARDLGLDKVLLVDESGKAYLTEEMNKRIEFVEGVESVVVSINN